MAERYSNIKFCVKYNKKSLYKRYYKYFYISTYSDFITPIINKNNKTEKIKFAVDYFNNICSMSYPYTKYLAIDEKSVHIKVKYV